MTRMAIQRSTNSTNPNSGPTMSKRSYFLGTKGRVITAAQSDLRSSYQFKCDIVTLIPPNMNFLLKKTTYTEIIFKF